MSSRSKLDDALDGAAGYADIETVGIANVMERLGEAAPAVVEMQAALIAGIVRSQNREAARLADQDPFGALAADARAERFYQVQQEFAGIGSALIKVAEGHAQSGVFHGFVFTAEGTPAVDYKIELRGLTSKPRKATTDETGYFRMKFVSPAKGKASVEDEERDAQAAEAFAAAPAAMDHDSEKEPARATVTVSSPSGRALLTDPTPPTADEGASIFRYYPLPPERAKGRTSGKPAPEARTKSGAKRRAKRA